MGALSMKVCWSCEFDPESASASAFLVITHKHSHFELPSSISTLTDRERLRRFDQMAALTDPDYVPRTTASYADWILSPTPFVPASTTSGQDVPSVTHDVISCLKPAMEDAIKPVKSFFALSIHRCNNHLRLIIRSQKVLLEEQPILPLLFFLLLLGFLFAHQQISKKAQKAHNGSGNDLDSPSDTMIQETIQNESRQASKSRSTMSAEPDVALPSIEDEANYLADVDTDTRSTASSTTLLGDGYSPLRSPFERVKPVWFGQTRHSIWPQGSWRENGRR